MLFRRLRIFDRRVGCDFDLVRFVSAPAAGLRGASRRGAKTGRVAAGGLLLAREPSASRAHDERQHREGQAVDDRRRSAIHHCVDGALTSSWWNSSAEASVGSTPRIADNAVRTAGRARSRQVCSTASTLFQLRRAAGHKNISTMLLLTTTPASAMMPMPATMTKAWPVIIMPSSAPIVAIPRTTEPKRRW